MNLKKLKNKLLIFIISFIIFSMPLLVLAYSKEVYLGGDNVGIEVSSNGVLVVGFYDVNNTSPGEDAGLKIGDIIVGVDDTVINEITDLSDAIYSKENIKIRYVRDKTEYETTLNLIYDDNMYKTGLYIKDKIVGIGTLTFIDLNNKFGALGHQIIEKNTGQKFEIGTGSIFESIVTDIEKSEINNPGEKNADYYEEEKYGIIEKNTISGIYGNYTKKIADKTLIEVAEISEIKLGKAKFKTVISGNNPEEFEINIIKINKESNTKNFLFEVTDKKLLSVSNGIVQGMSGSPIIQNNKLIGAVTHVVIDDPKKGYGIYIGNMLNELEN